MTVEKKIITPMKAIKTYFEGGKHGKKVEMAEFKKLSKDDRKELAELAAVELGMEIKG